jgi:hypothetical protein
MLDSFHQSSHDRDLPEGPGINNPSFNPSTVRINSGVGAGALNAERDVRIVQQLLNLCRVRGPNPKLAVTGKINAATMKAIKSFQDGNFSSCYWTAGFCDGRIDPSGPTFWLLRTVASNTETPVESIDFVVPGIIQPIRQIGPTCWAAASVILRSWKKQSRSLQVRDEIVKIGQEWLNYYDLGTGLPFNRHQQFAEAAGMRVKPPASYTVGDLRRLLLRPSPIYVAFTMSITAAHAVVIIGMSGDGTSVGTDLIIHDTAVGSPPDRLPFVMMNLWVAFSQHVRNRDKVAPAGMPNGQLLFF